MPSIKELKPNKKKAFKKRDYRPYNPEGAALSKEPLAHDVSSPFPTPKDVVLEIDPKKIRNWEFHDRPSNELGDIDSLAEEFLSIGQQIPCIVRNIYDSSDFQYELIAGERRWRAAQKANITLKVLIRNLSDNEAALVQISENSSRSALSDYAKGMSYSKLIEKNILNQSDLVEKLKISKQQISRFLSFNKLPIEVLNALEDMSKISAGTAEQIKQLSAKGDAYVSAIINYAPQIAGGKIGKTKLAHLVNSHVNHLNHKSTSKKVYSLNGRHLYTWRNDNNSIPSIHFPRNITLLIAKGKLDKNTLINSFKKILEDMLMDIK
jgi:ParB family chromosome partitioning protein